MSVQPIVPGAYVTEEAVRTLADTGITTGYEFDDAFDLSLVSPRALTGQVRLVALNEDHHLQMTRAMLNSRDTDWPALILWKVNAGQFDVLDGLHRIKAARDARRTTLPAIVVDLSWADDPSLLAQQIKIRANLSNGLALTTQEAEMNGLWLCDHDVPVNQAAQQVGLTYKILNTYVHSIKTERKLEAMGFPQYTQGPEIPRSVMAEALGVSNGPVLLKAIAFVHTAAWSVGDKKALMTDLKKLGDQTKQEKHLAQVISQYQAAQAATTASAATKTTVSRAVSLTRSLRATATKLDPAQVLTLFTTPAAQQQGAADLKAIRDDLTKTIRVLEKASAPAATPKKKSGK